MTPSSRARPPSHAAPQAIFPISVDPREGAIAPIPLNDRFPIVIGQSLSLSYIANVFRLATTGYRQQYVDLLNELLEQDPHLYSVLQKRILSTANGRLEVVACELDEDDPRAERAEEIKEFIRKEFARIPNLVQHMAALMWGIYYGLSGLEIFWSRDGDGWHVDRFEFLHYRRLNYPDMQSWDLYIWDQGQVFGYTSPWGTSPTNSGVYGARIADYPGKFVVFAPQLRGDYPTRDGLGRQLAVFAALKRIAVRNASQYLERFAKPVPDISWSTSDTAVPREATAEDIAQAKGVGAGVGVGSLSSYAHPDSIIVKLLEADGANAKITFSDQISICNSEESKAVLGGTLGTEVSKTGGNRSLGEVQERGEVDLEQYDSTALGQTFERDVVAWLVRLNFPGEQDLAPHILIHVDKDPDPMSQAALAKTMTEIGAPVDVDNLSDDVGIKLVPNETGKPRRTYLAKMVDALQVDPTLKSPDAEPPPTPLAPPGTSPMADENDDAPPLN